jgi:hypothetical protein
MRINYKRGEEDLIYLLDMMEGTNRMDGHGSWMDMCGDQEREIQGSLSASVTRTAR